MGKSAFVAWPSAVEQRRPTEAKAALINEVVYGLALPRQIVNTVGERECEGSGEGKGGRGGIAVLLVPLVELMYLARPYLLACRVRITVLFVVFLQRLPRVPLLVFLSVSSPCSSLSSSRLLDRPFLCLFARPFVRPFVHLVPFFVPLLVPLFVPLFVPLLVPLFVLWFVPLLVPFFCSSFCSSLCSPLCSSLCSSLCMSLFSSLCSSLCSPLCSSLRLLLAFRGGRPCAARHGVLSQQSWRQITETNVLKRSSFNR